MKPMQKIWLLLPLIFLISCNQQRFALPTGLSGNNASNSTNTPPQTFALQLNWNANVGEQQGFYIEQSVDGVNFSQIQTVADPLNSATVNVTAGTWYFRVRGYNQAGDSPYTTVVKTTAGM